MLPQAAKMTRKGRITSPAEIRNALDIHEGDYLLIEQVDGRIVLERAIDIARDRRYFQAVSKSNSSRSRRRTRCL